MIKYTKTILSLILITSLIFSLIISLSFCKRKGNGDTPDEGGSDTDFPGDDSDDSIFDDSNSELLSEYDKVSRKVYEAALGDFYVAYREAKKATTASERYALMAVAEAKLLESGVMLPLTTKGGNYAISRVAPYTSTTTLWGNDSFRYHNAVITATPITAADRDALKAMWAEITDAKAYESAVREYLTEKGYTFQYEYSLAYNSDPKTWDVLASSRTADAEALVNTYDGLLEYDMENNLKGALATSYDYNWDNEGWQPSDGYKVTFTLRQGVKWVDSQGRTLTELTADDFVAGLQHMLDAGAGLEYLVDGIIVNADAYLNGQITDFSEVGVTAVDRYTLCYELTGAVDYFDTMVGYGVFAPLNRAFYEVNGGKFGENFDPLAETYKYGSSPEYIAYCGPYTVSTNIAENTIVFAKNTGYWNADNVTVSKIIWKYNDGKIATKSYDDMKSNTIAGTALNSSSLANAKGDIVSGTNKSYFDLYGYVSGTNATSFMAFLNLNRRAFANASDASVAVSSKTEEQKALTAKAMQNKSFRLALAFATNRASYNAQTVGEELKYNSLRNSYIPGTFVRLREDVTIPINGKDTLFRSGAYYGEILQAQLDADDIPIRAWDPTQDGGIGSSDGYDGWYSVENARKYLKIAVEELSGSGISVSRSNPVVIDLPVYVGSDVYTNRANAYKQSVESASEGLISVNLVACESGDDWYYAGYYTDYGFEANYDIYDVSGWGPDFGDPSTYLDTMLPDYAGYMVKCLGIF